MNVETYLERVSGLEIDRGQLDRGFVDPMQSVVDHQAKRLATNRWGRSNRVDAPPLDDADVGHLARTGRDPDSLTPDEVRRRQAVALNRARPETRPFYRLLYARGLTVRLLALRAGVRYGIAQQLISGHSYNAGARSKLAACLQPEELAVLNWR
jgi:hypothetical protein